MKLLVLFLLLCATMAHGKEDPNSSESTSDTLEEQDELNNLDESRPEEMDDTEMTEDNALVAENDCGQKARTCHPRTWCTNRGIKYMYVPNAMHWAQAQRSCQGLGGTLATVHNSQVNNFLKQLTRGTVAWIGLSDAQRDGFWLWINGERLVYTNWCRGEPNNLGGSQECAAINWTGAKCWDDQKCTDNRPFLCEKKP